MLLFLVRSAFNQWSSGAVLSRAISNLIKFLLQNSHRSSHHKSGHHKHRHHHHHHHHKRSGDKSGEKANKSNNDDATEENGGEDAPPSQRVQFILGGENGVKPVLIICVLDSHGRERRANSERVCVSE